MTNFKWPLNRPAWATLWDMDTRPLGLLTELCSGNWPIAYSSLMLCVPYIRNIVLSFGPAHKSFRKRQSGRNKPKKKQKTRDYFLQRTFSNLPLWRSFELGSSEWRFAHRVHQTVNPSSDYILFSSGLFNMILQVVELLIQLTLLFTVKRGGESVPINWVSREICAAA